jgi:hypothetical protein
MRLEAHLPKNNKSRRISAIQRLLIWCGEGDLNPKCDVIYRISLIPCSLLKHMVSAGINTATTTNTANRRCNFSAT